MEFDYTINKIKIKSIFCSKATKDWKHIKKGDDLIGITLMDDVSVSFAEKSQWDLKASEEMKELLEENKKIRKGGKVIGSWFSEQMFRNLGLIAGQETPKSLKEQYEIPLF